MCTCVKVLFSVVQICAIAYLLFITLSHIHMYRLSKDYMNDFVLHGTVVPADDFRMALLDNLMAMLDSAEEDGTTNQASCVVADLSKWCVLLYFILCFLLSACV